MIVFWSGVIELVIEFQTREGWEKKQFSKSYYNYLFIILILSTCRNVINRINIMVIYKYISVDRFLIFFY